MKLAPGSGLIPCSFRTLPPFRLTRAREIGEAVAALAATPGAAVLAGGTDMPARFNEGFAPTHMVDISGIAELGAIAEEDGGLVIGALVTHAAGSTDPLVRQRLPGFAAAWARIANVRVRFSATLGGNVMAGRTRYEGAILLAALGARLRLATASGSVERYVGDGALASSGELLVAVVIPLAPGLRFDYERSLRPIMTQALALDRSGAGRVATATEFALPRVELLRGGRPERGRFAVSTFGDPVTGDAYLARMREVLLARQIARLEAA